MQRHRRSIRQFVKFGIVGGSGVVVNMLVTVAMHKLHGGTVNGRAPLFPLPPTPYYARYLHLVRPDLPDGARRDPLQLLAALPPSPTRSRRSICRTPSSTSRPGCGLASTGPS